MNAVAAVSHPKDIEYVTENFATLEELCRDSRTPEESVREEIAAGIRPRAAYTLVDGREFFPYGYLAQRFERDEFESRVRGAATRGGLRLSDADVEELRRSFLSGVYAVCLKVVMPENIVRKRILLERIEQLIAEPREDDAAWFENLREAVDALDELERPFSPYFDRVVFGRPPTRDSHIRDVRVRFGV